MTMSGLSLQTQHWEHLDIFIIIRTNRFRWLVIGERGRGQKGILGKIEKLLLPNSLNSKPKTVLLQTDKHSKTQTDRQGSGLKNLFTPSSVITEE
jgi:fatty acid-binding protein DegV